MDGLKKEVKDLEAKEAGLRKQAEQARDAGKLQQAESLKTRAANQAKHRNALQNKIAEKSTRNDGIRKELDDLNRPPGTPQQEGRFAEGRVTNTSGWPKNNRKFQTSFKDASAPDGKRIPDFAPVSDNGLWRNLGGYEPLGSADFIADSKLYTNTGKVRLTEQLKGFVELAKQTKNKALLLITDQPLDPAIEAFAKRYGVVVKSMTQPR